MTFAVRPLGLSSNKSWEYIQASGASSSKPLYAPAPVRQGDLLVCCFAHGGSGGSRSLPPGWTWMFPADSPPRHCYRIAPADSSSLEDIWPQTATSSGYGMAAQFRPVGGSAYLANGSTNSAGTAVTLAAPDSPSILLCIGTSTGSSSWTTRTTPALTVWEDYTSSPMLYAGYAPIAASASTGSMQLLISGGQRASYAIFGIS